MGGLVEKRTNFESRFVERIVDVCEEGCSAHCEGLRLRVDRHIPKSTQVQIQALLQASERGAEAVAATCREKGDVVGRGILDLADQISIGCTEYILDVACIYIQLSARRNQQLVSRRARSRGPRTRSTAQCLETIANRLDG